VLLPYPNNCVKDENEQNDEGLDERAEAIFLLILEEGEDL